MSEYWVSTKKYWCKHCETFVKDSPLSRQQHDATPRHQNALKRFLRDLHRGKERDAVATENAKREADRLNNLGNPNFVAQRPLKSLSQPEPSTIRRQAPSAVSEEQRKRNLDELAALGVAMPENYKKEHAMVGEWETVRVITPPIMEDNGGSNAGDDDEDKKGTEIVVAGGEKRKLGENEDEEEEAEIRRFKVRTREYPLDDGVEGLDDLLSKGKVEWKGRKKSRPVTMTPEVKDEHALSRESKIQGGEGSTSVKVEEEQAALDIVPEAKEDSDAPATGFAFKKRKTRNPGRSALA